MMTLMKTDTNSSPELASEASSSNCRCRRLRPAFDDTTYPKYRDSFVIIKTTSFCLKSISGLTRSVIE